MTDASQIDVAGARWRRNRQSCRSWTARSPPRLRDLPRFIGWVHGSTSTVVASRSRRATVASVARHLAPGDVAVDAHVAGQAEHTLAEDVVHHLGVPPSIELARLRRNAFCSVSESHENRGRPSRSRRRASPPAPSSVDGVGDVLVEVGRRRLGDRALGAGVAELAVRLQPGCWSGAAPRPGSTAASPRRGRPRRAAPAGSCCHTSISWPITPEPLRVGSSRRSTPARSSASSATRASRRRARRASPSTGSRVSVK